MHTTSFLFAIFGSTALCQTVTMNPISQISDGQIQEPSSTPAAASTTPVSTTSAPYSNPFTSYTTETNSAGVITSMSSVVISQPAVPMYSWNTSTFSTEMLATAHTSIPVFSTLLPSTAATSFCFACGTTTAAATVGINTGGAVANGMGGAGVGLGAIGLMAALFF